jgi:exopolysaccharide production protein ExoQ
MEAIINSSTSKSQFYISRIQWFAFILIIALFFIALHNPQHALDSQNSLNYTELVSRERGIAKGIEEGSIQGKIGFLGIGLFGIFGLLRKDRGALSIKGLLGGLILFFFIWSFLSIIWTDDIPLTIRKLGVLALLGLGALAFASRFSLREIVWFAFFSTAVYVFIGVVTELSFGTFSPWASGYQFSGTLHPNTQGINCSIMLISALYLARTSEGRRRLFFLIATLGALIFLILTRSRTSFASAIIAIIAGWVSATSTSRRLTLIINIILAVALFLVLFGKSLMPGIWEGVLLGRDPGDVSTLTGRTLVWDTCMVFVAKHPFIGYGYGAFWTSKRTLEIMSMQEWDVSTAHSAFIDLTLGLGLPGMILYVLTLFMGIKRCLSYYSLTKDLNYVFLGSLLIYCFLSGFLESLTITHTFATFLLFIVLFRLGFMTPVVNNDNYEEAPQFSVPDQYPNIHQVIKNTPN